MDNRTLIADFEKLNIEVKSHKISVEEENALIQRHVKNARDKCAELTKKFELAIEKF